MCGLVGMINTKPTKFDFTRFCTLGISNDSRGGDSVGIYIDGKSEFYCNGKPKLTLFEDIISESKLLQETQDYTIAFAHCRKASVGAISLETAQPVIIKNDDNQIDFVLMHNGTIYNTDDLAKEYIPSLSIKGMTDSQIMANIFYHRGYEVLSKYNGAAVFMILDYRENREKPKFLCWKGKSKESKYRNNGAEVDERPFYFVADKEHFIMSSIERFFASLYKDQTVYTLPANTLCSWDGELWIEEEYSRKDQQQDREYKSNYPATYPSNNYTATHHNTGSSSSYNYSDNDTVISSTVDGKCYKGKVALHGMHYISDYGRFCSANGYCANEMWFWNGTLLKNQAAYTFLSKFQKEMDASLFEIDALYPELVLYLSPYPFIKIQGVGGSPNEVREIKSPLGGIAFTGILYYPFVRTQYEYQNGIFQTSTTCTTVDSLGLFKTHVNDVLDYEILGKFTG